MFSRFTPRIAKTKERAKSSAAEKEKEDMKTQDQQINEKVEQAKLQRGQSRQEGRKYAEEFTSRPQEGLTPEERKALQYEANKGIHRGYQAAHRKLLGEQGQHGIVGKGGVGYAQQRDLMRGAQEARGGVQRDLTNLDRDLAMKKRAQNFAIESGEVTQNQLDRQIALDELELAKERKKQDAYERSFNSLFNRV